MDDGIKIALSPVQLAATLSDKSITESETLTNRLMGGLGLVMGTLELAGATALCMAPEPTGLTKVACAVLGTHSLDSINSAASQVLSGKNVQSATYRVAADLAKSFGADDQTAWKIGLTVDVAVPLAFSFGIGAVRVASIRVGRIRLIEHESISGEKTGGHAILRHVGMTKNELLERLNKTESMSWKPPAVSSFKNLKLAEESISKALKTNREWIRVWASSKPRHNLIVTYNSDKIVGYTLFRGSNDLIQTGKIKIVLKYETYNGKPYYILTAYPEV